MVIVMVVIKRQSNGNSVLSAFYFLYSSTARDVALAATCNKTCTISISLLVPIMQAADIVQLVGIGRNEYIAIMNKCKAKKLLWRVNKSIAKEFLPTSPSDVNMQPWWKVGVVNLSKPFWISCLSTPDKS